MANMRVGLIGTGYWAQAVHGTSVARHPRADLVGIWGRDPNRAAAAADVLGTTEYPELERLLEDVDALTFAVPPDVQAEIAVQAAERGRHLLLEKPIALSVAEAQRLEEAIATANVGSIVFFTRRFDREGEEWAARVAELGDWDCGRVETVANIYTPAGQFSNSPWRQDRGALWDLGPHALSMLWPALGPVTEVVCGGGRGDQVHLALRHAGGGSSTISVSESSPEPHGTIIYVYGARGRSEAPSPAFDAERSVAAHQRALDALIELAPAPGVGHPCDVHFGARVVEVLAAAEESLRAGRASHLHQTSAPPA